MTANRRDFFRSFGGLIKNKEKMEPPAPLPPFFDGSKIEQCQNCTSKHCASLCPEGVLKISQDGAPRLDFSERGCTFCEECATSCEYGVFSPKNEKKIYAKIEIDAQNCLAWHNTICKSCMDPCLDKAIDFTGMFFPQIVQDKCTACGFCIKVCPANAITVKGV